MSVELSDAIYSVWYTSGILASKSAWRTPATRLWDGRKRSPCEGGKTPLMSNISHLSTPRQTIQRLNPPVRTDRQMMKKNHNLFTTWPLLVPNLDWEGGGASTNLVKTKAHLARITVSSERPLLTVTNDDLNSTIGGEHGIQYG